MPRLPRLFDFVRTDFPSLLFALMAPVGLGFAGWAALRLPIVDSGRILSDQPFERLTQEHAVFFTGFAIVGALAATVVVAMRLRGARRAFAGVRVPGHITKVTKFKDRAYLHFSYEHAGQRYETWRFVHQTHAVLAMNVGSKVEVAFAAERPRASWVVELFG